MPHKFKADHAAWKRAYRAKHRERVNAIQRASQKRRRPVCNAIWRRIIARASDYYVRRTLSGRSKTIHPLDWPDWLVEFKRRAILLKRKYGIHQNGRRRS